MRSPIRVVLVVIVLSTLFLSYLNLYELGQFITGGGNFLRKASLKRVDKYFFFELLSQYDPVVSHHPDGAPAVKGSDGQYMPTLPSEFSGLADRLLLVQYLAERFAYSSYLQISCRSQRTYQLLADSKVTLKLCVDAAGGGTHTVDPVQFISDATLSRSAAAASSSAAQESASARRYDMILVESEHVALGLSLLDGLLDLLAPGGVMVLTGTTEQQSSWREVLQLRQRDSLDVVTLDADHGLTVITQRHNQAPLPSLGLSPLNGTLAAAAAAAASADPASTSGGSSNSIALLSFERFSQDRARLLHLQSFEDLHQWLAPTGNVDLLTAFGGRKGLDAYRESLETRRRCNALLATSRGSDVDRAIACFNEALLAGRLTLMSRWQLAVLLVSRDKLVDAVTMLGELQAISPAFYKWVSAQTSLALTAF